MNQSTRKLLAAIAVGSLSLAACGGDDREPVVAENAAGATSEAAPSDESTNPTDVSVVRGVISLQGADELSHLPEGTRIVVTLEDVSLQDAPASTIATYTIENAATLPVDYELSFADDLSAERIYNISAEVYDGDDLMATTDTAYEVGLDDSDVDLEVVSVYDTETGAEEAMTITGTIISIEDGIDGSTVDLATASGVVTTVISVPNLGPDSEFDFANLEVGTVLTVTGELYGLDGSQRLTAAAAERATTLEGEIVNVRGEDDSTVIELSTTDGTVIAGFGPLNLLAESFFIFDWLSVGNTIVVTGESDTIGDQVHVAAHSALVAIDGQISSVSDGRDGATVVVTLADGSAVTATVSIPNLGPDSDFDLTALEEGARVSFAGETFEMDGQTHMTVRGARSI